MTSVVNSNPLQAAIHLSTSLSIRAGKWVRETAKEWRRCPGCGSCATCCRQFLVTVTDTHPGLGGCLCGFGGDPPCSYDDVLDIEALEDGTPTGACLWTGGIGPGTLQCIKALDGTLSWNYSALRLCCDGVVSFSQPKTGKCPPASGWIWDGVNNCPDADNSTFGAFMSMTLACNDNPLP